MGKIVLLKYTSILLAHKTFLRTGIDRTTSRFFKLIEKELVGKILLLLKFSFLLTACKCKFLISKKEME